MVKDLRAEQKCVTQNHELRDYALKNWSSVSHKEANLDGSVKIHFL